MELLANYDDGENSENTTSLDKIERSPPESIPKMSTITLEKEMENFERMINDSSPDNAVSSIPLPVPPPVSRIPLPGDQCPPTINIDSSSSSESASRSPPTKSHSTSGSSSSSEDEKDPPKKKTSSSISSSRSSPTHSSPTHSDAAASSTKASSPKSPTTRSRSRSRSRSCSKSISKHRSHSPSHDRRRRSSDHGRRHRRHSGHRRHRSGHSRRRHDSRERSHKHRSSRSRSRDRHRRKHRRHSSRSKSRRSPHHSRRHRRSRSPQRRSGRDSKRSRSRSRSPSSHHRRSRSRSAEKRSYAPEVEPRKKHLTYKEQLRQQLLKASKILSEQGSNGAAGTEGLGAAMEKPSNLPLNATNVFSHVSSGATVTPQMALFQTMAAMHQKAQEITGIAVPKYYNPAAVNPIKYAEQVQKRKLLWSKKEKKEESGQWQSSTFLPDQDGKQTAKFRKLMGMKEDATDDATKDVRTSETVRKQEELFQRLDKEYEFARMATHTHRGVGLGFQSHSFSHQ